MAEPQDSNTQSFAELNKAELFNTAAQLLEGDEHNSEKRAILSDVSAIVCKTELPKSFPVVEITSTQNKVTEMKYEALLSTIPQEKSGLILPPYMLETYPLNFDMSTLEKAPWVNMVHAWMKVFNLANTLSAIQQGKVNSASIPETLVAVVDELYGFTTVSDGKFFRRSSTQFEKQEPFPETIMRENGTRAVNPERHVCLAEMSYILNAVREIWAKDPSSTIMG